MTIWTESTPSAEAAKRTYRHAASGWALSTETPFEFVYDIWARFSPRGTGAGLAAILLTQLLYPVAAMIAATTKRVSWRGIEYKIGPGTQVTMLNYHAFVESDDHAEQRDGKRLRSIG